jgi:hypothetical protein
MERERYPGVLWLLPIFWGFTGGIIAAVIAGCAFRDSWWELFFIGIIVQVLWVVSIFLSWSWLLSTIHF